MDLQDSSIVWKAHLFSASLFFYFFFYSISLNIAHYFIIRISAELFLEND